MAKIGTFPSRSEWLRWRHGNIGASDAPAVMGVSPYKTRCGLWEEMCYGSSSAYCGDAMIAGVEAEPRLLAKAQEIIGAPLAAQVCYESDMHSQIIATIDGVAEMESGTIVVETKLRHTGCWESIKKTKKLPVDVFLQMQQQMHCAGSRMGLALCEETFDKTEDILYVWVEFDEEVWEEIFQKEMEFLTLVANRQYPKHYRYLPKGVTVASLPELCEKWKSLMPTREELARAYEREQLEEQMKELAIRERKTLCASGVQVKFSAVKGRVDYDRLVTEKGLVDALDDYRKPESFRTAIALEKPKG